MSKEDAKREPLLQSPQQATMGEADGDRCSLMPQTSSRSYCASDCYTNPADQQRMPQPLARMLGVQSKSFGKAQLGRAVPQCVSVALPSAVRAVSTGHLRLLWLSCCWLA